MTNDKELMNCPCCKSSNVNSFRKNKKNDVGRINIERVQCLDCRCKAPYKTWQARANTPIPDNRELVDPTFIKDLEKRLKDAAYRGRATDDDKLFMRCKASQPIALGNLDKVREALENFIKADAEWLKSGDYKAGQKMGKAKEGLYKALSLLNEQPIVKEK